MSFRSSQVAPPWVTKFTKSSAHSSAADSTTSQGANSNESLVIEDLDLDDLDLSPPSVRTCTPSVEDPEMGEYLFYPEIGNHIFGEQIPEVVSEACVMNDLYILVKVPTNPARLVPTSTTASQTTPKSTSASPNMQANKNRRIFSIREEEDEHNVVESTSKIPVRTRPKSKKPCWVQESDGLEEFASKTNIIRNQDTVPLPNQVPDKPEESLIEVSPKPPSPQCQNQLELQEVNFNSVYFKGPGNVSLENYGILITPTKTPKSDNLLVFQVDTEPQDKGSGDSASCFEWLTRCFRKKAKQKGFVHAKVYKTYFVKWKKCSHHSECPRCKCRTGKSSRRNSA